MTKTTLRATLVTTLVAPVLLLGSAAEADTATLRDATGDAPKTADITRLKGINGKKNVTFAIKVRKLRMKKLTGAYVDPARHYYIAGFDRQLKKLKPWFAKVSASGEAHRQKCKGMKLSTNRQKRIIVIKVPQRCFGEDSGPMQFAATLQPRNGELDKVGLSEPVRRG